MPRPNTNDRILLDDALKSSHSRFPELSESEHFEQFVASEVLKNYELDDDEIATGITDGEDDGQIDGFYTFVQGRLLDEDFDLSGYRANVKLDVVILQAKKERGFGEVALTEMRSSLEELFDLEQESRELRGSFNEQLVRRVNIFRDALSQLGGRSPAITFSVYYATVGQQPNQKVLRKAKRLEQSLEQLFPDAASKVYFLGARELLQLTRTTVTTAHKIKAVEVMPSPEGDALVLFVTLHEYVRFLTATPVPPADGPSSAPRINEALFESNVRAYQGSTSVNSDIRQTLEEAGPEDFWYVNNGITILCGEIEQRGKSFTITNPQIVNGLQTSREVFDYWTGLDEPEKEVVRQRHILVRIIDPEADSSRNKIIRATNTQNRIPEASLRSTDEVHRDIEDYFKRHGLFYDRRKNHWRNEGKPRSSIVPIPSLAQSVAAVVLQRPSDARARPSSLINKDPDYQKIFNRDYPLSAYLESVRLMRRIDGYIREHPPKLSATERKDLRFHVASVVAALHLDTPKPKPDSLTYGVFDDLKDKTLAKAFRIVLALVSAERKSLKGEAGDLDRIAKSATLTKAIKEKLGEILPAKTAAKR